jgi:membrane protein implicated in regulation of membrane protease activity
MQNSLIRLIITIAAIIVGAWLIILAFKLATWIINGLIGVAAVIVIIALAYRFVRQAPPSSSPSKKTPLKIEREPSKEK